MTKVDSKITVPIHGEKITVNADNSLNVPNHPIIPFIEGDGIGIDITTPMQKVVDAAVNKVYGNKRKIAWMEVFAGEKAVKIYGKDKDGTGGGNLWHTGTSHACTCGRGADLGF